jgi:hypothetical protein
VDEAQFAKLQEHLSEKWQGRRCPMCQSPSHRWLAHAYVQLAIEPTPGLKNYGPANILPSAAVMCSSCGYTVIVNLVVAGVLPGTNPAGTS